jgi:hypothetical protein
MNFVGYSFIILWKCMVQDRDGVCLLRGTDCWKMTWDDPSLSGYIWIALYSLTSSGQCIVIRVHGLKDKVFLLQTVMPAETSQVSVRIFKSLRDSGALTMFLPSLIVHPLMCLRNRYWSVLLEVVVVFFVVVVAAAAKVCAEVRGH